MLLFVQRVDLTAVEYISKTGQRDVFTVVCRRMNITHDTLHWVT